MNSAKKMRSTSLDGMKNSSLKTSLIDNRETPFTLNVFLLRGESTEGD